MGSWGNAPTATRGWIRGGLTLSAALASLILLATPPARAAEGDQRCLTCHRAEGLQKNLPDGDKLALHVDGDTFAKSVHTSIGCGGATATSSSATIRPAAGHQKRARLRGRLHRSLPRLPCRQVHRMGGQRAPSPTPATCERAAPGATIRMRSSRRGRDRRGMPCQRCHQDITRLGSAGVHAQARRSRNELRPLCSGCHGAHGSSRW